MKFLFLLLFLFSCSSKRSLENSNEPELVIGQGNSVESLFEDHHFNTSENQKTGSSRLRIHRKPASAIRIGTFNDRLGKLTKKIGHYKVKESSETLMLIAFELYGDFKYWKSLASLNSDVLDPPYALRKGLNLKYYEPKTNFVYRPDGLPFLIKRGHSLSKISDIVYENWRRWPEIHENNLPLIHDPNKIYAGFTLYYLPDDEEKSFSSNWMKKIKSKNRKQDSFTFKKTSSPLMNLVYQNIANRKASKYPKRFGKVKNKLNRVPASIPEISLKKEKSNIPKKTPTQDEYLIIQDIKKAVELNNERKSESAKTKGSLLNKVKNSFKQFDYY